MKKIEILVYLFGIVGLILMIIIISDMLRFGNEVIIPLQHRPWLGVLSGVSVFFAWNVALRNSSANNSTE